MFMGVLYHLRYPLLALDLVHRYTSKDMLVFQSMLRGVDQTDPIAADYNFEEQEIFNRAGAPRLHFVEHQFAGDPTNWWIPNRACVEAMLRSSGFEIVARPEHEVYVCRCS
jgi:tRNA (mo5U34)-methyltransferase